MRGLESIVHKLQQRFFDSVVSSQLVYNTCWEDPRIDRELLDMDEQSEVVMLSSAGCNALDYLLDDPRTIHCVDTNPAQNALLELKIVLFLYGSPALLWNMLGRGQYHGANLFYHQELRGALSKSARMFWDQHITYFSPSSSSFYFKGTSGAFAYIIHQYIKYKGLHNSILHLLDAHSLREQRYYFDEAEPQLWSAFSRWLLNRNATMTLLGVPPCQRAMIDDEVAGGLSQFIHRALVDVFTKRPIRDNYFWRVYLTGSYTRDCCPNYLKEEHFEILKDRAPRVHPYTGSMTAFLRQHPGSYSHFILLDHQDWLAHHHPEKLAEEWALILDNAQPGAKILFRSAGISRSFLPGFVCDKLTFSDQKTKKIHAKDRVGTYGSTHLATVHA